VLDFLGRIPRVGFAVPSPALLWLHCVLTDTADQPANFLNSPWLSNEHNILAIADPGGKAGIIDGNQLVM
jgi:hypothetical protein